MVDGFDYGELGVDPTLDPELVRKGRAAFVASHLGCYLLHTRQQLPAAFVAPPCCWLHVVGLLQRLWKRVPIRNKSPSS